MSGVENRLVAIPRLPNGLLRCIRLPRISRLGWLGLTRFAVSLAIAAAAAPARPYPKACNVVLFVEVITSICVKPARRQALQVVNCQSAMSSAASLTFHLFNALRITHVQYVWRRIGKAQAKGAPGEGKTGMSATSRYFHHKWSRSTHHERGHKEATRGWSVRPQNEDEIIPIGKRFGSRSSRLFNACWIRATVKERRGSCAI